MRVSVIRANKITNIMLPNNIEGSYWISDIDKNGIKRNLISIEANGNSWRLCSNNDVYCVENEKYIPFVELRNNKFYLVKKDTDNTEFLIFCSELATSYTYYDITEQIEKGIYIGKNENNFITYSLLDDLSCVIKSENNLVKVIDNNSKYGIYKNNVRVFENDEIKSGDVLFLLGLKLVLIILTNQNSQKHFYLGINQSISGASVKSFGIGSLPEISNTNYDEVDVDVEYPLYDESEYFHKIPRFLNRIKALELKVDAPPAKAEDNSNSLLLTIGPMLTMSMTSLVTGYTALNSVLNGDSTWSRAMPSLVICGAMFASVFIWPFFSKKYEKKMRKRNEKKRQEKYGQYIEGKRQIIIEAKREQSAILKNNYPDLKECLNIIYNRLTVLWQRKIEDHDFLEVNLGIGTFPMKIDIKYPEDHFSMVEDNLKDMVMKLGKEPKELRDVPIVFSLLNNYISALIGNKEIISEYARKLLVQILTHHSYDELKIVVLTDEDNEYRWKFLKKVSHNFTDDKNLRFFATNSDEYKEVCYYLDKVYESRKENTGSSEPKIENFKTIYLVLTDSFKKIKNYDIISKILENKTNYGFSFFILDEKITNLPDQCSSFIKLEREFGELIDNNDISSTIKFTYDNVTKVDYEAVSSKLACIPIEFKNSEDGQLPNKVGFLELYDVGKVEQLNSLVRWENSNPMLNLSAPVGLGKSGEIISIDLHEKYHGPHGLIAGMTGSGKSEFIITYILSMALNYHPYEVQFILIDYKGGGLAGAFENSSIGLKLPHLVGTITNLDTNEINRSLASIESELKRRQALFNKAREISGESTIDIYKYQKMYRNKVVSEPVSHLFIISDEFAELKNQQPEFMEQLISTARIGRSLGVHLILATQKPSGVVDPQIWSNTRFRVCMRVQDKSDSNEVIKCNDAAYLKQTGRFYFQVGFNEVFVLGQAAWAGGKYVPKEKVNKTLDTSIDFINNVGYSIKNIETKVKKEVSSIDVGEELINIVKYLSNLAEVQNIHTNPLWLDKISDFIKVENLAEKYKYKKEDYIINPIVGEYDVPSMQEQRLLTLPFSKEGNAVIYGASGSGKENFITTLLYSSLLYYNPEEVNFYIIDFGSEALKMFNNCPIVGDVLGPDDEEKIENLFKMLTATIEERKRLFADYNGDYGTYCKKSNTKVPNIIVIINNYESYQETYSKFDETLIVLSRECNRYGIYFLVAINTPNGMRFKLKQNFSLTYVLQQNSDDDYTTILGNVYKTYPAKIFGRGIIKTDTVYEFQTAFATERDKTSQYIREQNVKFLQKYNVKAKNIPILPQVVGYYEIESDFGKSKELIIGINKETLKIHKFNFAKNYITIVSSLDLFDSNNFINCLINQIIVVNNKRLIVINAEDYEINNKYKGLYKYVDNKFDEALESLYNFTKEQKDKYIEMNYDKTIFKDKNPIYCIIIGIDNFKNRLKSENKNKLGEIFNNAKDLGIINYIVVDSIDKIKKVELEPWYKNCVHNNSGIWFGNGINDQFSIKINQKIEEMKKDVPIEFCFVIYKGKANYVKYVSQLELNI